MTQLKEVKRRNGYYQYKEWQFPSVSTILKSAGTPGGLINWAATQGGLGVIWGISKIKNLGALQERLEGSSAIEWAKEQAQAGMESERDRTAGFGTNVHDGIEGFLKGIEMDQSGWTIDAKTALETFKKFYGDVGFDPIAIETDVYCEKFRFAGRLDLVAAITQEQAGRIKPYLMRSSEMIQPGLLISDFKTGSLYVPQQEAQLAAYAEAYLSTYSRECTGGLLINIPRETPEKIKCYYSSKTTLDHAFEKGFLVAYQAWEYFDSPKWFRSQFEKNAA